MGSEFLGPDLLGSNRMGLNHRVFDLMGSDHWGLDVMVSVGSWCRIPWGRLHGVELHGVEFQWGPIVLRR